MKRLKKIKKNVSIWVIVILIVCGCVFPHHQVSAASNNERIVYEYLINAGFNNAATAGILANIEAESSFDPTAKGDYDKKGNPTSYGICQWRNDRWTNLRNYRPNDWTTLNGQLAFLIHELEVSNKGINSYMRNSIPNTRDGAYEAGRYWCYNFERPKDKGTVSVTRGNRARNYYWPKYCGQNPGTGPTPDPGSTPQPGGSPVGVVDEVSVRNGNSIYIRGWAYDPDDQNHNVMLEAYIDTTRENATAGSGYQFRCTQDRPDVRAAYNLTGSTEYGFEDTHPTSLDGGHVIYIYATNQVGGGDHSLLGMYTLNFRDTHAPYGSVDVIEGGNGTLRVAGWAKDDDDPEAAVTAHVYIGGPAGSGAKAYAVKAEGYRSDVGNHAFDKVINITDVSEIGEKDIYIYWLNLGEGNGNPHIQKSATIKAPNFPNGAFDICQGGDGTIFVRGWAKDDDDPNACLEVHVYVGGRASNPDAEGHVIMADYYRSDVGQHGFNRTIAVNKTGEVEVHVYAINIGGGWSNTYLGQKTVTVNARETIPPEISNVTVEPDKDGYTVTCEVNDTESSIDRVVFPTWTLENGQDDLAGSWATADTVRGTIVDGRATFRVNRSDHNDEYGTYRTHIYAYDGSGNRAKYEVPDILYRHTVSFDANGGENAPESMTKYLCDSLVLPTEIPVRDGYFFIGYSADRNAEEAEYQPGGLFTEDEDTTLYAIWRPAVPDAELPADLTEIEEEAFAGSGFKFVEIPSGVTKIGDRAFADCPDLMYVKIPPAATNISDNAFENAPEGLTIIGEEDSLAEYYAWKNGYGFQLTEN